MGVLSADVGNLSGGQSLGKVEGQVPASGADHDASVEEEEGGGGDGEGKEEGGGGIRLASYVETILAFYQGFPHPNFISALLYRNHT